MTKTLSLLTAIAFALGTNFVSVEPISAAKAPAKTKLGCIKGKEKWDASIGKCMAVKKKPVKKAKAKPAKKMVKAAPKKA